jgi:hypothetical protein
MTAKYVPETERTGSRNQDVTWQLIASNRHVSVNAFIPSALSGLQCVMCAPTRSTFVEIAPIDYALVPPLVCQPYSMRAATGCYSNERSS